MFRLVTSKSKQITHLLIAISLLARPAAGEDELLRDGSTLTEAISSGDALRAELHKTLRGLKYPQTINTETVVPDTELLDSMTASLLRWKTALEAVLFSVSDPDNAALDQERKAYLINLYFGLLANLLQMKQIIVQHIDWRNTGEQFALTVPLELTWSRSQALSRLFTQQLQVKHALDEGQASLQLKDAFVDGLQIATLALQPNRASHLAAVKYLAYATLYKQLVQNEHYRGNHTEQLPELPTKGDAGYDLGLRESIVAEQRNTRANQFLYAALLEALPRLQTPETGLQQPLIANWHLYEQLQAAHPDMTVFTTQSLAQQVYALLDDKQRESVAVNDSEEMYRLMLLAEQLYLPMVLQKELNRITLPLDGSDAAGRALLQLLVQARFSALLNALAPLRIKRDKIKSLLASLQERQATLLAMSSTQEVTRWYEAARKLVPEIKQRTRLTLIREVLYAAWKVDTAENNGNEPLNLQILRRSLLRSLYVTDFSGEFQQSLAAILQARGYEQSRMVFFNELARHLQRLVPHQPANAQVLRLSSQDDIVRTYVNPALAARASEAELESGTEPEHSDAAQAVQRKTMLHHITQIKALLQHGYWFGYFTYKGDSLPSLDDLPLNDQQRANYWRELRFARFDLYPFLLLPLAASKDKQLPAEGVSAEAYVEKKQPLYKVFATKLRERDLRDIGNAEVANFWPLVAEALDTQRQRILVAIQKIDAANSVQDIKHLAANSPAIASSMKEFAALYPMHEKFAHRYHQPSKLQHSWERIDFTYIGNFFTVIIGWHLGGWLLRKSVPTSYLLRYLNPAFGAIFPYTATLMMAFWYVILVDYFGIKIWQTFVSKPRKFAELQEYYYLGNQHDQFINRTYLDYLEMEKTSHIFNYGFEAAMLGLFIGWAAYNHLLPHLVPNVKNVRLRRLFSRVGFRTASGKPLSEAEVFERRQEIFNRKEINKLVEAEIATINEARQAGRISKSYARQEKHQIELARDKIFASMAKKERAIRVAEIEHTHDFRALGLSSPVFNGLELEEAYQALRAANAGNTLGEKFALRDGETALISISQSLERRLHFTIIRSRRDINHKIRQLSKDGVIKTTKDGKGNVKAEELIEGGYGKDLDLFGIPRSHRNPFSRKILDEKVQQFNRDYAKQLKQEHSTDPIFLKKRRALERLLEAAKELEEYRYLRGWHSAMFEALAERRLGYVDDYSEAELLDLAVQVELLGINLKREANFKDISTTGGLPSVNLNEQAWQVTVAAQHKKITADYRAKFKGSELRERLKELKNAQDVLLNRRNHNAIDALIKREHYANYYRLLGLDPVKAEEYSVDDIKNAYKRRSFDLHPDKGGSDEEMQALNTAQEIMIKHKPIVDGYLRQYLHGGGQ